MKKGGFLKKIILFFVAIIAIAFVWESQWKKVEVTWRESFNPKDKMPYGLYVFDQEIDGFFKKRVERTYGDYGIETEKDNQKYNFIFFDHHLNLEIDKTVIERVRKGSNLMVISDFKDDKYFESFLKKGEILTGETSCDSLKYTLYDGQNQKMYLKGETNTKNIWKEPICYIWKMSDNFKVISYVETKDGRFVCSVEKDLEKGKIYIIGESIALSNYYLREENGKKYAQTILNLLDKDYKTVWFNSSFSKNQSSSSGFLSTIAKHKQLRWGWRIMLLAFVSLFIFSARRRQKVIPKIQPQKNNTIEFVKTISNFYHQENKPEKMMEKLINLFLCDVRERLHTDTNNLDENFVREVEKKSLKDKELIQELVKRINTFKIEKKSSHSQVVQLERLIHAFWS